MSNQSAISSAAIIRRGTDHVEASMAGEVVMMSIQRNNYYALDEVGSRVWRLLQQPRSVAALCRDLRAEYEVDADICEQDLIEFLTELRAEGLVTVSEPPAPEA